MVRKFIPTLTLAALVMWSPPLEGQNGAGCVIERIELRGNRKTKPEVILRSLALREGERLTPNGIDASREALYRTRLFRTVHLASKPGTESGTAVVVVFVDEKRFGDLGIGLEYTELDGYGVSSDAYHVNLWGEGKVIGAQWTLGERLKSWSVGYTDPWISGSDYSLHLKAFTSSSDRDLYRSRDPEARGRYDLERIGGHVGIGQPVGGNFRLVLKYSFEDVQVGGFQEPTVPTGGGLYAQEVGAAVGRKQVSSFGLDLYRRSIGRAWGSTPGTDASLQASFSPKYLGSTANFLRLRTEIYRHISILPGQILSVGGRAGTVLGSPPFYERLYLDGPNQLRGLERRKLGPEGGAQFASAELLYSISLGGLGRLYSFVEGAGVRRPIDGTVRRDSDWTAGVGILLFNRVDISLGISTGTLIVKSHRFGGINVDL